MKSFIQWLVLQKVETHIECELRSPGKLKDRAREVLVELLDSYAGPLQPLLEYFPHINALSAEVGDPSWPLCAEAELLAAVVSLLPSCNKDLIQAMHVILSQPQPKMRLLARVVGLLKNNLTSMALENQRVFLYDIYDYIQQLLQVGRFSGSAVPAMIITLNTLISMYTEIWGIIGATECMHLTCLASLLEPENLSIVENEQEPTRSGLGERMESWENDIFPTSVPLCVQSVFSIMQLLRSADAGVIDTDSWSCLLMSIISFLLRYDVNKSALLFEGILCTISGSPFWPSDGTIKCALWAKKLSEIELDDRERVMGTMRTMCTPEVRQLTLEIFSDLDHALTKLAVTEEEIEYIRCIRDVILQISSSSQANVGDGYLLLAYRYAIFHGHDAIVWPAKNYFNLEQFLVTPLTKIPMSVSLEDIKQFFQLINRIKFTQAQLTRHSRTAETVVSEPDEMTIDKTIMYLRDSADKDFLYVE